MRSRGGYEATGKVDLSKVKVPSGPAPGGEPRRADMSLSVVLEATTVRPGDTLLVAVRDGLTMADVDRYRDKLAGRLPGVEIVILPANGFAVYRPDPEPSTGEERA